MTEEQYDTEAVSEPMDVESTDENQEEVEQEEQKMVPLSALQAERRKRQDTEARNRVYEEMMSKNNRSEPDEDDEDDDPEALITKSSYNQGNNLTKREILEQVYQDMNPKAVQDINLYLKPILDKKPWLAATVDNSVNRLSRAAEIVEDYRHLVEDKPRSKSTSDARRIIENSQKPRSPSEVGKSAQPTGTEYLKSIQGKKEFREYRQKVLRGEA